MKKVFLVCLIYLFSLTIAFANDRDIRLNQLFNELKVNKVKVPYKIVNRRKGDVPYYVADNSLAKKILNWKPKRDLELMCKDSWNWYLKNPIIYKK